MLKSYTSKLILRSLIFISGIYIYVFKPALMELIFSGKLHKQLFFLYIVWGLFITGMLLQLLPKAHGITMGCMKHHKMYFIPSGDEYTPDELHSFIRYKNIGAAKVLASWLAVAAIIGALYFTKIIGKPTLLMITLLFYVSDLICVVIWCPFQSFMMKNRCCVNCRIFNWGYAMMFTPLIFIPSFFSWSLVLLSAFILIQWEIRWHLHPERFWDRANSILQCKNCRDKICKIKKPLLSDNEDKAALPG